jgi:RHS repeat-associated protein
MSAPANVSLQITAYDTTADRVYRVDYYNGSTLIGTVNAAPWSLNYAQPTAGTLSLKARIYTTCNSPSSEPSAVVDSGTVTVNVVASSTPSASITLQGNSGLAPAAVALSADVTSPGNVPISRVEFLANGNVLGSVSAAPYRYTWTNAGQGTWYLQARAVNNQGATGTSSSIAVTVNAAPALPPDPSLSLTRTSSFEYDPVTGLLVKEIVEPGNSALCLVTVYRYDDWGNKDQATTRNCNGSAALNPGGMSEAPAPGGEAAFTARTSSTVFDGRGQFPVSSTNAEGHSESYDHVARFGSKKWMRGPNGLDTSWTFDVWGRKTHEYRPDQTGTYWEYSAPCTAATWMHTPNVAICYQVVQYEFKINWSAWNGYPIITYVDQLERKLFSSRITFNMADWIDEGLVHRDELGRVIKEFRPYERGQWGTASYSQTTFDLMGRPTSVFDSASNTVVQSSAYDGLTLSSTRYPGNAQPPQTTITVKNVVGQTARSIDAESGRTRFVYDAHGNLRVSETQGVVTQLQYDLRGRKTGMTDPDMGAGWQYAYNAAGELVRQVDAKSQTTTIGYDRLGRMLWRSEPDQYSAWEYDRTDYQAPRCGRGDYKTVGKLVRAATNTGYERIQCYDGVGRPTAEVTTYGGDSFRTDVEYQADTGKVWKSSYPTVGGTRLIVENVYRADNGYLTEVKDALSAAYYWRATSQNAFGQLTGEALANGSMSTSRVYDSRGRLYRVTTSNGIQDNTSNWNDIDTVINRTWVSGGTTYTEYFSYDRLNRLQDAGVYAGSTLMASMQTRFDSQGNLISKTGVGTYNYVAGTHRLNMISGGINGVFNPTFIHDNNGNVTNGAAFTTAWTSFNMPNTITKLVGGTNVTDSFNYGPEHQRVRQIANLVNGAGQASGGTLTTLYVGGGLFEKETNSATGMVEHKHYIAVAGRLVTVFIKRSDASTQWNYFHQDHLGSTVAVSNGSGGLIEAMSWDAWGKRRNLNGTPAGGFMTAANDRGYTGHEQLDNIGLVHMNGRIYDPALGRFVSADPIVQAAEFTQSHNRYMYVVGNPLTLTDPSGYSWLSKTWKKAWNNQFVRTVIIAVAAYYTAGWASEAYASAEAAAAVNAAEAASMGLSATEAAGIYSASYSAASSSVAAGFVGGAAGGGAAGFLASNGDLKAAAQGALTGGMFGMAGAAFPAGSSESYIAHAAVGCGAAALGGGNCARGAAAQLFSKYTTNAATSLDYVSQGIVATASGGVVSKVTGGKFSDGARTAAFGYLFNRMSKLWRERAVLAGTFLGGTFAGVAASGCTAASGGACALGAPTMVVGGMALGAAAGDAAATAVDAISDALHGNSLLNPNPTTVYELQSRTTGEVLKYGITSNADPTSRYSTQFYETFNAVMVPLATFSNRMPARMLEVLLCTGYAATHNNNLPPLSKTC